MPLGFCKAKRCRGNVTDGSEMRVERERRQWKAQWPGCGGRRVRAVGDGEDGATTTAALCVRLLLGDGCWGTATTTAGDSATTAAPALRCCVS